MKAEDGTCSLVPTEGHCAQIIKGLVVAKENAFCSIVLSINKQEGQGVGVTQMNIVETVRDPLKRSGVANTD